MRYPLFCCAMLAAVACAPVARSTGVSPVSQADQARRRLIEEARRAIEAEALLTTTPAIPNTIAVLPWTYLGTNPELKPLERGLAHLLVTDLAKVGRFTLLERTRVQALADELALADSARVAPATAARSGRLLRAAEVLQGAIHETSPGAIRLDANLVTTNTSAIRATGTASDRLEQLFSMEKSLVFELLDRMGVSLSPAERRAISERPTADLQAFLSFSRGLEAEDRGDAAAAARFFETASTRDPGFRAARRSTAPVSAARLASPMASRVAALRTGQLAVALQTIAPSVAGRMLRSPIRLPALRSRLAEALRQDDPSRLAAIGQTTTTIPRP